MPANSRIALLNCRMKRIISNIVKKTNQSSIITNAKFHDKDFVDFKHRDEIYFGVISGIYQKDGTIYYNIDIAGQCPTTYQGVEEERVIRLHPQDL